jgi:hypothetical protein
VFNPHDIYYAPPYYPPGYPLLLAPVFRLFGFSFPAFFQLNSALLMALMPALYFLFRKQGSALSSVLLAVLVVYSGCLMQLKVNLLSDIPCLLWITVYMALRQYESLNRFIRLPLLVFLAILAVVTRTQALLLPLSELVCGGLGFLMMFSSKQRSATHSGYVDACLIGGITLLLYFVLNHTLFSAPADSGGYYRAIFATVLHRDMLELLRVNLLGVLLALKSFFFYPAENEFHGFFSDLAAYGGVLLVFAGMLVRAGKGLSFADVFGLLLVGMLLLYPLQDARYLLPALPLAYGYARTGVSYLLRGLPARRIAWVLTFMVLMNGWSFLAAMTREPEGLLPGKAEHEAFATIQSKVSDSDVIVCFRPRFLSLFTGKHAVVFASRISHEANKHYFDSLGARYFLVYGAGADSLSARFFTATARPLDTLHINDLYTLYRLK